MLPEDFARERNFVSENGYAVNPSTRPKFARPHMLEKRENLDRYDEHVPSKNTLTYPETVRKSIHKSKWAEFLKGERTEREKKAFLEQAKRKGTDPVKMANDPLSLGLESRCGLTSPRLELPAPDDPLAMAGMTDMEKGAFVKPSNRPAYQLEDGSLALRTYKEKPESSVEMRDCKAVLHPMDITKLVRATNHLRSLVIMGDGCFGLEL
eukprot:3627892-Pyramimonas_sp.AAC.1